VASVHRLFRRFLNTTPRHYIARLRTEEAKRLLRTTSLSIAEVGARVGYEDPFHFSRFFKHQTGFPPSVYRRRASIL
jgi:AraC-like DNA-binding protein